MNSDKNGLLVLGTAIGYTKSQVAPFLRSLRASGYAGSVVLLVDRRDVVHFRDDPLFADVTFIGVTSWPPQRYPALQKSRAQRWIWRPLQAALWATMRLAAWLPLRERWRWRLQIPLGGLLYTPTESRFLRYYDLVASGHYSRILLSDVRDVIFQTDPFEKLPVSGLAISLEVPDYTIGTERWNQSRVLLIYGEATLRQVAGHPVSCSGVTAGDAASMRQYLELMTRDIFGLSLRALRHGWFDQAIHNVVLRTRWQQPLHGLATLSSAVATLGAVPEAQLRLDSRGRLLNHDGSLVSVVHQYDRKPGLRSILLRSAGGSP